MEDGMTITEFLENLISMYEKIGHPALMERFVFRNGREYEATPYFGRRGVPKECFSNAAHQTEGVYCEGYVRRKDFPILIHHAWRVDGNKVIDCTLDRPEECQYYGVEFTDKKLYKELRKLQHYGILDTPTGINIEMMIRWDAGIKRYVKPYFD